MTQARPHLLAVSEPTIWPNRDGFTLRTIEILRELGQRWDISLIAPVLGDHRVEEEELKFRERVVVPLAPGTGSFPRSNQESLRKAFSEFLSRAGSFPDAFLFWGFHSIPDDVRSRLSGAVYDMIDCATLNDIRAAIFGRSLRERYWAVQSFLQNLKLERNVVRSLPVTITVGERDASILRFISRRPDKVVVVSNGVREQNLKEERDLFPRPTVIFSGVLNYPPNVDAAIHFARTVFPALKKLVPEAECVIAGRSPSSTVVGLGKIPGIRVEAAVPDMFALLKRAWVAAAPMRQGAGVKNKVLEAWSVGTPVVMSRTASNGLVLEPELQRWVSNHPGRMAALIAELLLDKQLLLQTGRLSYRVVREKHGWNRVGQAFDELLRKHCLGSLP